MTTESIPGWAEALLDEVAAIAAMTAELTLVGHTFSENERLCVLTEVDTASFEKSDVGYPVESKEQIVCVFSDAFPRVPPRTEVLHDRWVDQPHMLEGRRLCIYLDSDREWDPAVGIRGYFSRLWDWLDDASAGRFDATTALHFPVGGVVYRDVAAPMLVISEDLPGTSDTINYQRIRITRTGPMRLDLVPAADEVAADAESGLLITVPQPAFRGFGNNIPSIAQTLQRLEGRDARRKLLRELERAMRTASGQHFYLMFSVQHPDVPGEKGQHVIAGRTELESLEASISSARGAPSAGDQKTIQWVEVDDCRAAKTTRRDEGRPTDWFAGKSIELWGCGALGGWLAESLARAGVASMTLRDSGRVHSGLLVRQNFLAADVGRWKSEALADRLALIAPHAVFTPKVGSAEAGTSSLSTADLIVDCTTNLSVARTLDAACNTEERCPVAYLATDVDTATLGILTISSAAGAGLEELEEALRSEALDSNELKSFRTFWDENVHPPLTPTNGCSVPTFRGSAADSSAIAATAASLLGRALQAEQSAGYLFQAAHSSLPDAPDVVVSPETVN